MITTYPAEKDVNESIHEQEPICKVYTVLETDDNRLKLKGVDENEYDLDYDVFANVPLAQKVIDCLVVKSTLYGD